MAEGSANCSPTRYGSRTICLPIEQEQYAELVQDASAFRRWLQETFRQMPELFPDGFDQGFQFKDYRMSKKLNVTIRRVGRP